MVQTDWSCANYLASHLSAPFHIAIKFCCSSMSANISLALTRLLLHVCAKFPPFLLSSASGAKLNNLVLRGF